MYYSAGTYEAFARPENQGVLTGNQHISLEQD